MSVTVERTNDAILIKLPLDTDVSDIQNVLNYFEYVSLVSKSQATHEDVVELAKNAKAGWWENNKHRFEGVSGFEDLV